MVIKELLVDINIDYDDFYKEALKIKSYASRVGKSSSNNDMYSSMMLHDITDGIMCLESNDFEHLELFFELFELAPSYTVLMYLVMEYDNFDMNLKTEVMKRYANYLFGEQEIFSVPVAYSLWVDYFEGSDRVEFSYSQISMRMKNEYDNIKKLIEVSGPVPYFLKKDLYYELASNSKYQELAYDGIINSISDVFGQIPREEAIYLLGKLDIDRRTETYKELSKRLCI